MRCNIMQCNEIVFCHVDNILLTDFMFSEALNIAACVRSVFIIAEADRMQDC